MKKQERVKSNIEFNNIINKGKKINNSFFTVFYMKSKDANPRFGVSVPKRVGNAVIRNKLKRQTREIINQNKFLFPKYRNYIIIVKDKCLEEKFNINAKALIKLIGETHEK